MAGLTLALMARKDTTDNHPSYGMVQINRTQSPNSNLFGSPLVHSQVFSLVIREGERVVSDRGDSNFYAKGQPKISIRLSPAHLMEMFTSMNVNSGVPCTIIRENGSRIEDCPPQVSEADVLIEGMHLGVEDDVNEIHSLADDVEEVLSKKGALNKKNKETVRRLFKRAVRIVADVTYTATMVEEAKDKMMASAKVEAEAIMSSVIRRAGLGALLGEENKKETMRLPSDSESL